MNLITVNLFEALKRGSIDDYIADIANFKSKDNPDVENFLKEKAINSCKLKQAVTYLVYDEDMENLYGYFTLTFKILSVPLAGTSKSLQKELERNGQRTDDSIQVPGVLLAQWSKNFAIDDLVPCEAIMKKIENFFLQIQSLAGGNFIFLECEEKRTGLISAYEKIYGYTAVSDRMSQENEVLIQMIKKI